MDTIASPNPLAHRFVVELIQSGLSLTNGLASLLESLDSKEPWPGEDNGEVLLEMTAGSIWPALRSSPVEEVERTIELIAAARERFVADLKLAAEVSGRRERMRR